ncbi:LA_2272 family surface repeat-containing protein [Chryseobacterium sp. MYb328]|uniref:LA_2272 family surface repeat-containing protein n=1 Tax=Chryseobacterium sp. MYb328 TaxID=2745231 RepID=UPI0030A8E44B
MKAQFFLIPILLFSSLFYASDTIKVDSLKPRFFGFSPSKKVKNINGVLFKYFEEDGNFAPKKVNGLGMGFNMIGIFYPFLLFFNLPDALSKGSLNNDYEIAPENKMNKINGVQLSLVNMEPAVTNGLEINVSSNINTYAVTNGVAVSPLYNLHHEIIGVSVAPFANVGQKCRGLQIGLYNSCKDFCGIQIGAWNENGKRKLPFVNWNFKKQKTNK